MARDILIVDDDPQIRDILRIALTRAGFTTREAANGRVALQSAAQTTPDLIVLDIGLPEADGLEVCRTLRKSSDVPVVFLTAHADEIDRVVGLELGADDYVAKPFSPRELVARINAILKRSQPALTVAGVPASAGAAIVHGVVRLDPGRHRCEVDGTPVTLTAREMEILARMIARPEQVWSRPRLVDAVYGANVAVSDRTLDSHLRNLRAKMAGAGCPDVIETVHGVGIRMGRCSRA